MTWDLALAISVWGIFLFIWVPCKHVQHRKRMRSLRAMNKGHRFKQKYLAIRNLTRGAS